MSRSHRLPRRSAAALAFAAVLAAVLALLAAGCATGAANGARPAAAADAPPPPRAEILWDAWGIPHIRAADDEALFFAYGWAVAHNHAERLLRIVGAARGRGAEYWGEEHLDDDRWYRTMGVGGWARRAYAGLDPAIRRHVDAYAAGVNRYLEEHPGAVSEEAAVVAPVGGVDLMANAQSIGLRFSGARGAAQRWLEARRAGEDAAAALRTRPGDEPVAASNAWAVGPSRSLSGAPLLLANPHLPWSGDFTWMEAHLTAPGVDVYGAALLGLPTINIGFNRDLGWTHTVNTQDMEDLYELEVVETPDGPGYRFAGEVRPFERRTEEIRVAGAAGPRRETLEVLRSVHGPVIARAGDRALAVRMVDEVVEGGLSRGFVQWWDMMRAGGLEEFQAALGHHAIGGQNVVYADRHGHVAYFYGAATPRRPHGDAGFWAGVLPGDDPELVWSGVHPFADMPRVVDPPSGWVQNANDPPWVSTWPPALDAADFPAYFAPSGLAFRPQRSIRMLRESGTLSLGELIRRKHSTRSELADRVLPELLEAAAEHGGATAREAAAVLAAWDRATDAGSRGAVLFEAWVRRTAGGSPFARPWSPDDPLESPDGLADPAAAAAALEAAAAEVEERWGRFDVAWGEACRLRGGGRDLPANGASGNLGVFRVTACAGGSADAPRQVVGGDSFVAAVELAEPPRAFALIAYGNASQAGSPHLGDQLDLYATQQLRPVLFAAEEVEARAVARTALSP
jgi:acyl-homoserine-lactone acylase